ncbi:MAG: hypothetical protein ABI808_10175 [Pseudonocardiales bacterium]
MITRAVAAAVLVGVVACATPGPAVAAPAGPTVQPVGPTVLFHITDPRITEASGIAVGLASPGVVYVQNDSGDQARFFALDARSGRTVATYTVPGATNVDWEDLAVAPDARGVPSVWLADIGDNSAARDEIDVYRVDEPHLDASSTDAAAPTAPPDRWRLRYPDGPTDAESLAVSPHGAAYVVTKTLSGDARVYALPARADSSRVQVLRPLGSLHIGFSGTAGGPNRFGQRTATGAALSRDGAMLAVRTYTDAYLWRVRGSDVAAAIRTKPIRLALPAQPLGEGVAFDGTRLLIDSERSGSAVYALALPAVPASQAPRSATSAAPIQSAPAPADDHRDYPPWAGIGAGLLIIAMVYLAFRFIGQDQRQRIRDRRRSRR